jgi:hypothetical protein
LNAAQLLLACHLLRNHVCFAQREAQYALCLAEAMDMLMAGAALAHTLKRKRVCQSYKQDLKEAWILPETAKPLVIASALTFTSTFGFLFLGFSNSLNKFEFDCRTRRRRAVCLR